MDTHTVIVGGGLAGLAAAAALAPRGIRVTLLESRPRLGGRASSFVDRETGTQIDNCQHVSMRCCTNLQHFCQTVGLAGLFRCEKELYFIGLDGSTTSLRAKFWPAPFHLVRSFRGLNYLTRREQSGIATKLRKLARVDHTTCNGMSFGDWLHREGESAASIERFWHVVLVSALSESLDRVDLYHARKVFVDAFLANRHGWEIQIPIAPLEELYGDRLADWLTARGADVRLRHGVTQVITNVGGAVAVELQDGQRISADHVVLAVPFQRVLSLLPTTYHDHPQLEKIAQLESAPISSVHLWFDRPITQLPHAVLIGRLSQWMFNRTALQQPDSDCTRHSPNGDTSTIPGYYLQVVISASRELAGKSQDQAIRQVVDELTGIWPETGRARLVHSRMVTEHKAVFSVKPGAENCRPPQQSPIPNVQLAGDWTKTGWPATMESAVRSGYLAAENVLGHLGRDEKLLQADLPTSLLSKILLGL
jgi:squalene-associated FAD-dependent desaturase